MLEVGSCTEGGAVVEDRFQALWWLHLLPGQVGAGARSRSRLLAVQAGLGCNVRGFSTVCPFTLR